MASAVGPLLTFSNPQHEAAFSAEFNQRRTQLDPTHWLVSFVLNCCGVLVPLSCRNWAGVAAIAVQGAYAAALACLARRRPAAYASQRTILCAAALTWHGMVPKVLDWYGRSFPLRRPMCASLLGWAFMEFNIQMAGWMVIAAVMLPLQTKHAAVVQAGVMALCLSRLGAARQQSEQLCSTGLHRYRWPGLLVDLLGANGVPLGDPALLQRLLLLQDSQSAYYLTAILLHLLTYGLALLLLERSEWKQRMTFACQWGLTVEKAGLRQRREQWGATSVLLVALGVAPWLACHLYMAGLRLGWIPAA